MTTIESLFSFAIAAALLTVTPGIDTALILRTSAVAGPRQSLLVGLGIGVGCMVWGVLTSLGLSMLLTVSTFLYNLIRLAGACYLLYLGYSMFVNAHKAIPEPAQTIASAEPVVAARWFWQGLFTNLLNPKVGLFYVTLLPQFIPAGAEMFSFGPILVFIHASESLIWFGLLILATRPLHHWLKRPNILRALDRLTGTILLLLGGKLLLEQRH